MDEFYKKFISHQTSLLIAPAGYGKTFTIAACVRISEGRQLVLTHTHAGVASIKEKIKAAKVPSSNYQIETITSFVQKYVLAFYTKEDIPSQDDTNKYYPFLIDKAIELFKKTTIANIVRNSYTGLFIDEYQDCSIRQHELVSNLSELLPTRIVGDYLQGIFDFNGEQLVDLRSLTLLKTYEGATYELDEPWRWKKTQSETLGAELKALRAALIAQQDINLKAFSSIQVLVTNDGDLFDPRSQYHKLITSLLNEKSLLIIYPESHNIHGRINFIKRFSNRVTLVEAIDGGDFYEIARTLDAVSPENLGTEIKNTLVKFHGKKDVDVWYNEKGVLKNKKGEIEKAIATNLGTLISKIDIRSPALGLYEFFKAFENIPNVKVFRKDLYASVLQALLESHNKGFSIYEGMSHKRNMVRRVGRKIFGRCIGTTLLTKGLEFETVLILDAHKFKCEKNLYVAMTRASKRLIVSSNSSILTPYTQKVTSEI